MNRNAILFHLLEVAEQLDKTMRNLSNDRNYSAEAFEVEIGHLYHHLNTAWNGREQTDEQFQKCTNDDFARFRKFPKEEEFAYLAEI